MNRSEHQRWDHNIHYHSILLENVPAHAERALDIGCGNGILSRGLRTLVPDVVGIDIEKAMIALAKSETDSSIENLEYILGDALTYPLKTESFDAIVCVATLHHMDTAQSAAAHAQIIATRWHIGNHRRCTFKHAARFHLQHRRCGGDASVPAESNFLASSCTYSLAPKRLLCWRAKNR